MRRRKAPKIYDQRIEYIDPVDCRSAIGYCINKTVYDGFEAELELINCDKKIHWMFDNYDLADYKRSMAKIDKAIEIMLAFRLSYMTHAQAFRKKVRKKK